MWVVFGRKNDQAVNSDNVSYIVVIKISGATHAVRMWEPGDRPSNFDVFEGTEADCNLYFNAMIKALATGATVFGWGGE